MDTEQTGPGAGMSEQTIPGLPPSLRRLCVALARRQRLPIRARRLWHEDPRAVMTALALVLAAAYIGGRVFARLIS